MKVKRCNSARSHNSRSNREHHLLARIGRGRLLARQLIELYAERGIGNDLYILANRQASRNEINTKMNGDRIIDASLFAIVAKEYRLGTHSFCDIVTARVKRIVKIDSGDQEVTFVAGI